MSTSAFNGDQSATSTATASAALRRAQEAVGGQSQRNRHRVFRAASELGLRTVAISRKRPPQHPSFKADEAYWIGKGKARRRYWTSGVIALAKEKGVDLIHSRAMDFWPRTLNSPARVWRRITFVGPASGNFGVEWATK